MSTNNNECHNKCERLLPTFSHNAVSRFRSTSFSAKGMKNNIVLHQANQSVVLSITLTVQKLLARETINGHQQQKKKEKGRKKKNKKQKIIQNTQKKLLQACKTWGGPCITPNELELCIQNKPDISEKIVKSELSYYVHPHQSKRNMEPTLFKIMIQHDECLESLLLFLIDKNSLVNSSHASVLDLPTKDNLSKKVFRLCN